MSNICFQSSRSISQLPNSFAVHGRSTGLSFESAKSVGMRSQFFRRNRLSSSLPDVYGCFW